MIGREIGEETEIAVLKIHPEQMEAFARAHPKQIVEDMFEALREEDPDRFIGLSDDVARALIRAAVEAARGCGCLSWNAVYGFVEMAFEAGADFHLHPEMQALFAVTALEPDMRVAMARAMLDTLFEE